MDVNLIVAIGEKGEIGRKGDLIWKIREDLKRFKSLTTGHPVIMGRKTWESLPKKPLPGRRNIILTKNKELKAENAEIACSIQQALEMTKGESPFIIGGAEIYKSFLPFVNRLYLTEIAAKSNEADTFLGIDFKDWEKVEQSPVYITEEGIRYQFTDYKRKT